MPGRYGLSLAALTLATLVAVIGGCAPPGSGDAPASGDSGASPRIVTLAPHLAELVYAAGAGPNLIGVSAYSNYPDPVRSLPGVGDAFAVDLERLALLDPAIILAWQSGTPAKTVDELRALGYRVETVRTQSLEDIAAALRRIGALTGHEGSANEAAGRFLDELDRLGRSAEGRESIRVFYQVDTQPLYTVNAAHYVSELIELCGGENVFADLGTLAPTISEEAVLASDPEVLLAGRIDSGDKPFAVWDRWQSMAANRYDNRFYVHADLLGRPGPRLVRAGAAICQWLEEGRRNRERFAE